MDRYLAERLPELSRTRIQELIEQGLVRVNGRASKGSRRLRDGERVQIEARERPPMRAEAEAIPLEILYEDEDVVVVNKPAGMTVHAGAGNTRGTLVNALLGRGQTLSAGGDALRPGIVHRLDKETSGAILVAKTDFAHAKLGEQFRGRRVKKTYVALVHGTMKSRQGRMEMAIGRDARTRTRMAVQREKSVKGARGGGVAGNAREARTDWRTLAEVGRMTLVEVELHTGRTHQIRVHFAAAGHPVVGDGLYGAEKRVRENGNSTRTTGRAEAELPELKRNFLHAARLGFIQPRTGNWIEVSAPLPNELRQYLSELARASGEETKRIDAAVAPYL